MTEREWLRTKNPALLFDHLRPARTKKSRRRLHLVACGCCRLIWDHLTDSRATSAVEVAERFADGLAGAHELLEGSQAASAVMKEASPPADPEDADWMYGLWDPYLAAPAYSAAYFAASPDPTEVARAALYAGQAQTEAASPLAQATDGPARARRESAALAEQDAQAALLRDIFGPLPFQRVGIDPGWLTPTVVALAEAAREERQLPEGTLDQAHLAVLADALEEAECSNADLLGHLRSPGPHVRGCFVVDLLLNRP